jgi:hypothetical protein
VRWFRSIRRTNNNPLSRRDKDGGTKGMPQFSARQALPRSLQERGERYRERMAGVSEKVVGHIASMNADSILTRSAQVEKISPRGDTVFFVASRRVARILACHKTARLGVIEGHYARRLLRAARRDYRQHACRVKTAATTRLAASRFKLLAPPSGIPRFSGPVP